ncbi:MAG: hypothetical protein R3C05_14920 [Pirellulaceae bacterium]
MNANSESQQHPELDGPLESAVWAVLSERVPTDAVERVKRRARSSQPITVFPSSLPSSHGQSRAGLRFIVAASVLGVIASGFVLLGIPLGRSNVYAQAAERLDTLTSLVCFVRFSSTGDFEDAVRSSGSTKVTFLAPSMHRLDDIQLGVTQIIDLRQERALTLLPATKQALVAEGNAAQVMRSLSPVQTVELLLRHFSGDPASDQSITPIGDHIRNGVRLRGFESTLGGETVRAWIDTETYAPVAVAVRFNIPAHMNNGGSVSMWRIMSNIELNPDVPRNHFAMTIPEDYEPLVLGNFDQNQSPATFDDMLEMLRLCAKANASRFPLSLSIDDSTESPMAILKTFASALEERIDAGSESEKAAALQTLHDFGSTVGRAMAFQFSIRPENDWNYFGGAKLNQADRPLLWYTPKADGNYTVLYADLTVQQVGRDQLPTRPAPVARLGSRKQGVRVTTPRFELPANAIRDYGELQQIRRSNRQSEVEYLNLALMPELIESQVQFNSGDQVEVRQVDPSWKPNRDSGSNRLAFLQEFTHLKGLDASYLYVTQGDLDTIANCSNLQRLSLKGVFVFESSSRRLIGSDLAKLSRLQSLEVLDLSQSNFSGGLHHLDDLPNLHTLYLSSFEHLNDATIAELKVLPHLSTLLLSPVFATNPQTSVTEQGLLSLQQLPRLKKLYVGHHGKWTLPVERLRELLPDVDVRPPTESSDRSQ